jgi:hypothetical protein
MQGWNSVIGHVLGLEGGDLVPGLDQKSAQTSGQNRFADIRPGTQNCQGFHTRYDASQGGHAKGGGLALSWG